MCSCMCVFLCVQACEYLDIFEHVHVVTKGRTTLAIVFLGNFRLGFLFLVEFFFCLLGLFCFYRLYVFGGSYPRHGAC